MLRRKALALILIFPFLLVQNAAIASEPQAPNGISAELWEMYKEVALWNIDGTNRNLKWNRPVPYFIKGNSNQSDTSAINDNLYKIASNCSNIKPGYSSSEPNEGVIIQFLPSNRFKEVIPETPSTATSSYAMYTYYIKRGLTKFDALIDENISDQNYRNWLSHLRVIQGFGFGGLTNNDKSLFFTNQRYATNSIDLAELDMQLISLYCSTLIRSWDSLQETKDYIDGLNSKEPNVYASYSNSLKVTATYYGFEIEVRPRGDLAIENGVKNIFYRVTDLSGNLIKSGNLDISENVFELQTIYIDGLQSNKTYKIALSNQNKRGYGTFQEVSERTINITGTAPIGAGNSKPVASDNSQAGLDAKNAALTALKAFEASKISCRNFYEGYELSDDDSRKLDFVLNNSKILSECDSQDADVELIKSDLKTGGFVDDYNNMTDGLNVASESLDAVNAELQDAIPDLVKIGSWFENISSGYLKLNENYQIFISKLDKYPTAFKNSILKTSTWKNYVSSIDRYNKANIIYEEKIVGLNDLERLVDVQDFLDQILESENFELKNSEISNTINAVSKLIPKFLRNFFYDIIAKNRYKWFGVKETCRMPNEKERQKLLY